MKIIFIRHGQTTGDVEDRYGGMYDDALSPLGEHQAQQLAGELANKGISHIYASPLLRAQQTAQVLAARVGCSSISTVEDLKERNQYGVLSGMVKAEAKLQYPEWTAQLHDRLFTVPEAETYAAASARTQAAVADMITKNHPCTAVVWHGGGMRILFRDILQWGELTDVGDCAWVELERKSTQMPWKISASQRMGFAF
ncbi:MAG: histidine phosphatase family protein [Alphaproteobacteria bacterium]